MTNEEIIKKLRQSLEASVKSFLKFSVSDMTQVTTTNGDTLFIDGDVNTGCAVYSDENGTVAEDGDYTLEDGTTFTISNGVISDVSNTEEMATADTATAPTDAPATETPADVEPVDDDSDYDWKNKNLGSVTQAGLVNNLNDGMTWGIFPILLASKGFSIAEIGIVTAIYPAVWGIGQLFTGRMADYFCKKDLLFLGMLLQGIALIALLFAQTITHFVFLSTILGIGTAMVYPTFLATVAENTHPTDRANSLGVFRFWRDLGYAIGAIITGIIADAFGLNASILLIGLLTIGSAVVIVYRMRCLDNHSVKIWNWITHREQRVSTSCKSKSNFIERLEPPYQPCM